jgi:hypothetical protein
LSLPGLLGPPQDQDLAPGAVAFDLGHGCAACEIRVWPARRYPGSSSGKTLYGRERQGPLRVPMSYMMPAGSLRSDLAAQYPDGTSTMNLILEGHRTATTRRPFAAVGQEISFPGSPHTYRVTAINDVDLASPEGRANWERLEGWNLAHIEADPRLRNQVYSPNVKQTVFERVGQAPVSAATTPWRQKHPDEPEDFYTNPEYRDYHSDEYEMTAERAEMTAENLGLSDDPVFLEMQSRGQAPVSAAPVIAQAVQPLITSEPRTPGEVLPEPMLAAAGGGAPPPIPPDQQQRLADVEPPRPTDTATPPRQETAGRRWPLILAAAGLGAAGLGAYALTREDEPAYPPTYR